MKICRSGQVSSGQVSPGQVGLYKYVPSLIYQPQWTVSMSSANGLIGTGFASRYRCVFKGPMGMCKATTPSSLSLTSNRVTAIYKPSVL